MSWPISTSGRVAIVGHSRGGYLAKALAARRPDQVSHVVTLGSGLSSPLDVAAPALAAVAVVRAVHRVTTDRVAQRGCMTATCACAFTEAYESPFPDDVRLTSIYSKGDGMVRWQLVRRALRGQRRGHRQPRRARVQPQGVPRDRPRVGR